MNKKTINVTFSQLVSYFYKMEIDIDLQVRFVIQMLKLKIFT